MGKTEIAFGGEVHPAACECHKGQFVVVALQFDPQLGQRIIGQEIFPTKIEAEKALESVVMKYAKKILELAGLRIDDAQDVRVLHGDKATQAINQVFNENNPNLH